MEELQQQLGNILANPELMANLMSMAQNFSNAPNQESKQKSPELSIPGLPDIDMATLQKISAFVGKIAIDSNQHNLLTALRPYLSRERVNKLEKAMRAAKLANIASTFLTQEGISLP